MTARIDDLIMQAGKEWNNPILEAIVQKVGKLAVRDYLLTLPDTEDEAERYKIVTLADVQSEQIQWLWQGYIPFGAVTKIEGDPGVGKGTLTLDIASRLSCGYPMPNDDREIEPADTILLTVAEDDLYATIKPRLEAAGADCSRIHAFTTLLDLPGDIDRIRKEVVRHNAKLVVIDPMNAYLSEKVNGYKDQDIRKALSPLKILAELTGAAIVLVHHLNKNQGAAAIYRGGGSIGITGAARCVLLIQTHPQKPDQRVLARTKGNLSAPPPSLALSLENLPGNHVARIKWEGEVEFTADQLLNPPKDNDKPNTALQRAIAFYRNVLSGGKQVTSTAIDKLLATNGISIRTAERARKEIGVRSLKAGFGPNAQWSVYIPESEDRQLNTASEQVQLDDMADFDEVGGVWDEPEDKHRQTDEGRHERPKDANQPEADHMADYTAEYEEADDDWE